MLKEEEFIMFGLGLQNKPCPTPTSQDVKATPVASLDRLYVQWQGLCNRREIEYSMDKIMLQRKRIAGSRVASHSSWADGKGGAEYQDLVAHLEHSLSRSIRPIYAPQRDSGFKLLTELT